MSAAGARLLLERMRGLSGDALAAAERGDERALGLALDERDRVAARLDPLLRELGAARAGHAGAADAVVSAAVAVREADAVLAARLAEIRAGLARELDRMEHAEAAAAAYAPPAGPRRLDLLR